MKIEGNVVIYTASGIALWSALPETSRDPGGELRHAGNRYDGIALRKTSGWRANDSIDDVDWEDYARIAGSPEKPSE